MNRELKAFNSFRLLTLLDCIVYPRDRRTRVSAIFRKIHVRVRVRVRGFKNFHVRVRVRVRGQGRTWLSADTGVRVHRSLVYDIPYIPNWDSQYIIIKTCQYF